jgi:hypothetical protein
MTAVARKTSALARAVNLGGRAMSEAGVDGPTLEADTLLASARRRTGLENFGDEPFEEAFRTLVDSLESDAGLSLLGRIASRQDLGRILANRLRMEEDCRLHPGIRERPVQRPLFITGMPRTGTTLLHGLLAQDSRARSPLGWETMFPSPPPQRSRYRKDRRIELARFQMSWLYRIIPEFRRIHPVGALLPQECLVVTAPSFYSFQFQTTHSVPTYQSWLEQRSLEPSYVGHKRFLQHLQWRCPGDWWVLKAPAHIFGLPELFSVYPDARVVMTHRDPLPVVGSLASLTAVLRSAFSDTVDPLSVGPEMSTRWGGGLMKALEDRDTGRVPAGQVFDVAYEDLMQDPFGTIQGIYDWAGLSWEEEAERQMRDFLAEHRKDKHGRHHYTLQEFGLDPDEEVERYRSYAQRFGLDGRRLPQ